MAIIPITLDTALEQRELDLMRLLARVRVCHGNTIHQLICPSVNPRTRQRFLNRLVETGLVWETTIPSPHRDSRGCPVGKAPTVYGLTERGYKRLKVTEVSGGPFPYGTLAYRPANASKATDVAMVGIDLYYADWAGSLIDQARRHPWYVGVNLQREYEIRSTEGPLLQTIGMLIELVFDRNNPPTDRIGPMIAWSPSRSRLQRQIVLRYGLDVDHAGRTERFFFEQAATYRRLSQANGYNTLFGSPVARNLVTQLAAQANVEASVTPAIIPVLIAAYDNRNERLGELIDWWWKGWDKWADGWALFSHWMKTSHPEYGVMWGDYMAVNQRPVPGKVVGRTPLMASLLGTLEQWVEATADWTPPNAPDMLTVRERIQQQANTPLAVGQLS